MATKNTGNRVGPSPSDRAVSYDRKVPRRCCELRTWTIRAQIVVGILSVAGVLFLALIVASVVNVHALGTQARSLASDALEDQIRTNAANFSKAYAKELRQTLVRRAGAVTTVASAASHAFYAADWEFNATTGSNATNLYMEQVHLAPGAVAQVMPNGRRRYVTNQTSAYYVPKTRVLATPGAGCTTGTANDPAPTQGEDMRQPGCYGLEDRLDAASSGGSAAARHARDRSAVLDVYMKEFMAGMPDVEACYMGFDASGLMRMLPAADDYFSIADYPGTYDPRKRGWYQGAVAAATSQTRQQTGTGNVLGPVYVSEPYRDYGTGRWMITVAQAVFNPASQLQLLGVVGFDITIASIQHHIINEVTFLPGGLVALIESEARGSSDELYTVAHVNFDALAARAASDAPPPYFSAVEANLARNAQLMQSLRSDDSGIADVTRGNTQYLVAHAKVDQPRRYTVLTIVPLAEALRPVERLKGLIDETTRGVSAYVVLLTLATGALVVVLVFVTANAIVKPVKTMVKVSQSIVSGAAEKDVSRNLSDGHMRFLAEYAQEDWDRYGRRVNNEMVMLTRSFLSMTQGLREDANRAKAKVVQPENPYFVQRENPLITALHNVDSNHWSTQAGGQAPIPAYAAAVARAVPVVAVGGGAGGSGVPLVPVPNLPVAQEVFEMDK